MIRISKKLSKSRILYLFNPCFRTKHNLVQDNIEELVENFEDEVEEDDDENINQIDQICDFIFYYEQSLIDGNKQL